MPKARQWQPIVIEHIALIPRDGVLVDHIDGDGLNNRRGNLRRATTAQNNANSGSRPGSSRFKGVSWHKAAGKWGASICVDGVHRHLGLWIVEEDAARAYDVAAAEAWGEFTQVNAP